MDDLVAKISIDDFVFRSALYACPIFNQFYLFSNYPILISGVNNFNNPMYSEIFLSVSKQIRLSHILSLQTRSLSR